MKRTLAALLIALLALLGWRAFSDSSETNDAAKPAHNGDEASRELEVEVLAPAPALSDSAHVDESTERVEIAPASAPKERGLTLRGLVRNRLGQPVEHFGIRGVRKDANGFFVEERVWPAAHHPGGKFVLAGLEPHAWELAPFAEGFTLEREQRFVRSNERPVVFRMLAEVEIQGLVLDARGLPVPEATIAARAPKEVVSRALVSGVARTTSDDRGRFRMSLDTGAYELSASRDGYADSEAKRIELAPLSPISNLELRLNDGCSVRIAFDSAAARDKIPILAGAHSLQGSGESGKVAIRAGELSVTLQGLAPGWNLIGVEVGSEAGTRYFAAAELESERQLELTFDPHASKPVAVRMRSPEPGVDAPEFSREYLFLPTLPNLRWMEVPRTKPAADPRWTSPSEWTAPGPGSYVVLPRSLDPNPTMSPTRFEVVLGTANEVELAPPERDRQSPADWR